MVQDKFVFKKIRLLFTISVTENSRTLLQDAKLPWANFKIYTSKLSPNYSTLGMFHFITQNKDTSTFSTGLLGP
jgi:hypothetical protein